MKLIAQKGQKCTFRPPLSPNNNFHGGMGGGSPGQTYPHMWLSHLKDFLLFSTYLHFLENPG